MRHRTPSVLLVCAVVALSLSSLPLQVAAWGAAGHAIVATIAQSLLHPSVRSHLCTILPSFTSYPSYFPRAGAPHTHCHLATLASWPDTAKWRIPWSGHYHYVNPRADEPPKSCAYGERGWLNEENVLTSLVNYTTQLRDTRGEQRDVALRFVTHLVGDAHQPLHLTGRARGGNDVHVRFEGRAARLHSVWDSQILNVQMRNLANYTTPLPSATIESALQGRTYDSYVRWILAEGLGLTAHDKAGWWSNEWETWPHCPEDGQSESSIPQLHNETSATDLVDETDLPLCPMAWTRPMHPLVCSYAFASPVPAPSFGTQKTPFDGTVSQLYEDDQLRLDVLDSDLDAARRRRKHRRPTPPSSPHEPPSQLPELSGDDYLGRIDRDKVVQLQLAKAGVRLAAILNSLLLDEALEAERKTNEASSMARVVTDRVQIWWHWWKSGFVRWASVGLAVLGH